MAYRHVSALAIAGSAALGATSLAHAASDILPFAVLEANQDFDRPGVVSNEGETLKSMEIVINSTDTFNEVKQVEFSVTGPPVPELSTWARVTLGFGGLGYRLPGKTSGFPSHRLVSQEVGAKRAARRCKRPHGRTFASPAPRPQRVRVSLRKLPCAGFCLPVFHSKA